jgi:hypothetical protein
MLEKEKAATAARIAALLVATSRFCQPTQRRNQALTQLAQLPFNRRR